MVESKAWNWNVVSKEEQEYWKNPSIESYYLLNRWQNKGKKVFLDLGCGIGRHTVLFAANGFDTYAFDLSSEAIETTKKWCNEMNLNVKFEVGDMLNLPYSDGSFDCILCRNVISHTDTKGMLKIKDELYRVLKSGGECYFTLGSKSTWGYKQDWPSVDENTKIRVEAGPENGIPHFYADYSLIKDIFSQFKIEYISHVEDFSEDDKKVSSGWHYHVLIKKDNNN